MSLRPLPLILSLILALAPVARSTAQSIRLPDIGDPAQADFGPDEEQKLGLDMMRQLRERGAVMDDVQSNEYLNSIGQGIATYADQNGAPFTFFMVRDSSINAFALPRNFIGINAGLLLATQREAELAGVIAHEIAHVSQHHIVRAIADMRRMAIPMAAAMVAGAALAAASKQAGQAAMVGAMATGVQHQISFTRANEQEADRIGMQLLARAGFDPKGMTDFFARLERMAGGEARNRIPEMLLTHPRPESRAADTQDRVEIPPVRRTAPRDRKAYDLAKARVRVLATDDNNSLIRDLETLLAKGGYASETAERYAYALALRQAGRYDDAQQQVNRLLKSDPDRLVFRIEAAELALARGEQARGWRLFEETRQTLSRRFYPGDALRPRAGHPGRSEAGHAVDATAFAPPAQRSGAVRELRPGGAARRRYGGDPCHHGRVPLSEWPVAARHRTARSGTPESRPFAQSGGSVARPAQADPGRGHRPGFAGSETGFAVKRQLSCAIPAPTV